MTEKIVLICEQDAAIRAKLSKALQGCNVKAEEAADVDSALKLMGKHSYDVVILNYSLAKKKGNNIFEKLRFSLLAPSSLIVIGEDKEEYLRESIEGGAYAYFVIYPLDGQKFSFVIKQALERKQLISENTRLKKEAELLQNIKKVTLSISLKKFSSTLLSSITDFTKFHCGFLSIQEGDKGDLLIQASKGFKSDKSEKSLLGLDSVYLKKVIKGGKPLFIKDAKKAEPINSSLMEEEGIDSLFLLPIIGGKKACGIVVIGGKESRALSKKDIFYVNKLLDAASSAIRNVLTFQKVTDLTIRDDITNAYNRRFFDAFMEDEIQRSRRYQLNFSIIFMDLNNFKRVNELYGHSTGSRMLGEIVKRMVNQVRSVDRVVRYGGDEFCIILPETDIKGAFLVAKRIKQKIEEKPFRFSNIEDTFITASFGISAYPQHGLSKKRLLSLADKAMFAAKKKKNNPIITADNI